MEKNAPFLAAFLWRYYSYRFRAGSPQQTPARPTRQKPLRARAGLLHVVVYTPDSKAAIDVASLSHKVNTIVAQSNACVLIPPLTTFTRLPATTALQPSLSSSHFGWVGPRTRYVFFHRRTSKIGFSLKIAISAKMAAVTSPLLRPEGPRRVLVPPENSLSSL